MKLCATLLVSALVAGVALANSDADVAQHWSIAAIVLSAAAVALAIALIALALYYSYKHEQHHKHSKKAQGTETDPAPLVPAPPASVPARMLAAVLRSDAGYARV
jgi:tellurite resistance protein TehA-like permease